MGIPKFFNFIKKTYSDKDDMTPFIFEYKYLNNMDYDILFLDYQSLIYSSYGVFCSEFNFFIRLIAYCHIEAVYSNEKAFNENKKIIKYILNKYNEWFILIFDNSSKLILSSIKNIMSLDEIVNFTKTILKQNYKDQIKLIEYISNRVVEHTKELSKSQLKNKKYAYSNTYIFFDGIPSIAKIKEQIGRRMFGDIISEVKKNIFTNSIINEKIGEKIGDQAKQTKQIPQTSFIQNLEQLENILLPVAPPSIGISTPIVTLIRQKLEDVNEQYNNINGSVKNIKFNINGIDKYGEAEHQLMKFIYKNKQQFIGKKILLASPDADLILLCLIASQNSLNIDIIRETAMTDTNYMFKGKYYENKKNNILSPFYIQYNYIIINQLKINIGITDKNKLFDICFALLLLGDDFVPIIPTMNIEIMTLIISLYDKLVKEYNDRGKEFNLINLNQTNVYEINTINLLELLKNIEPYENNFESEFIKTSNKALNQANKNIIKSLDKLTDFYNYTENGKNKFGYTDLIKYQMCYLIENGYKYTENKNISNNNEKILQNLIGEKIYVEKNSTDDKIKNYLQGCQFILDIYLNNDLKNYRWFYKYSESPTITEIVSFMDRKNDTELKELFDYTEKGTKNTSISLRYLDVNEYTRYSNENKEKIIKNAITKINNKETFSEPLQILKSRYFTYENIDTIVNCHNKTYFNKCIEVDTMIDDTQYTNKLITKDMLGGYYKKYLKYKNKYIQLKSK